MSNQVILKQESKVALKHKTLNRLGFAFLIAATCLPIYLSTFLVPFITGGGAVLVGACVTMPFMYYGVDLLMKLELKLFYSLETKTGKLMHKLKGVANPVINSNGHKHTILADALHIDIDTSPNCLGLVIKVDNKEITDIFKFQDKKLLNQEIIKLFNLRSLGKLEKTQTFYDFVDNNDPKSIE